MLHVAPTQWPIQEQVGDGHVEEVLVVEVARVAEAALEVVITVVVAGFADVTVVAALVDVAEGPDDNAGQLLGEDTEAPSKVH